MENSVHFGPLLISPSNLLGGTSNGSSASNGHSSSSGSGSSKQTVTSASLGLEPTVPKDLNPNYRPGPHISVNYLNGGSDNSRHNGGAGSHNGSLMSEAEQLGALSGKKGTRRQMYSGVKR